MTILFVTGAEDPAAWVPALRARLPDSRVLTAADAFDPREIEIAVVANPPAGALRDLPGLRLVQSLWMGVEGLVADPTVPPDVAIARMVDPEMTSQMPEAALAHVLFLHRLHDVYGCQQRERTWRPYPQPLAGARRVGVLGLGELGARTATVLAAAGFRVHGWSRTPKRIDGVDADTDLDAVLERSEILVNLLPLTPDTRGLLDAARLALLPHGACLVNLARGPHIVDADLLAALDSGRLRHAILDVFTEEPLPPEHPYWTHPAVTVMPHVAAQSTPESCIPVVVENVRRLAAGEPLLHLVDRTTGY